MILYIACLTAQSWHTNVKLLFLIGFLKSLHYINILVPTKHNGCSGCLRHCRIMKVCHGRCSSGPWLPLSCLEVSENQQRDILEQNTASRKQASFSSSTTSTATAPPRLAAPQQLPRVQGECPWYGLFQRIKETEQSCMTQEPGFWMQRWLDPMTYQKWVTSDIVRTVAETVTSHPYWPDVPVMNIHDFA